jgi:hypothetical protein
VGVSNGADKAAASTDIRVLPSAADSAARHLTDLLTSWHEEPGVANWSSLQSLLCLSSQVILLLGYRIKDEMDGICNVYGRMQEMCSKIIFTLHM